MDTGSGQRMGRRQQGFMSGLSGDKADVSSSVLSSLPASQDGKSFALCSIWTSPSTASFAPCALISLVRNP